MSNNQCDSLKGKELEKYTIDNILRTDLKFYGSSSCGHCTNQKTSFENHNLEALKIYVNCDDPNNSNKCKNITAYPTWESENKKQLGSMSVNNLCKFAFDTSSTK